MRKRGMCFAVWMAIGFGLALSVPAQITAKRAMSLRGYTPEIPVVVNLKVTVGEPVGVAVVEKPPAGWLISDISDQMVKEGSIVWDLPASTGIRTLTYVVIPHAAASGKAEFSGMVGNREIGGTTTMVRVEPEPIGVFQNHINFGLIASGAAEYNRQTDVYSIYSSLCSVFPNGHFLYSKTQGDCSIEALCHAQHSDDVAFDHTANLVIFNSLNPKTASCITMEIKGSGDCWIGETTGSTIGYYNAFSERTLSEGRMRIERRGDEYNCYNFQPQLQQWMLVDSRVHSFTDPVYIGLYAVCSMGSYTLATFRDVKLVVQPSTSAIREWDIYP